MKNILIRANSSSQIGLGHIKRDLVLAKEFKNSKITFVVEDLEGNINQEIKDNKYNLHILKTNALDELCAFVNKNSFDLIIIDSYDISYIYEKELKQRTSCSLMVLDDTYEKHYCDILLNHNVYAKDEQYKNLVPKDCELRCGENYTLIRDEFKNFKIKKTKNLKPKIFICMGGVDEKNISLDIVKALSSFDISIIILTSSSNKNINLLKECVNEKIDLVIDSKEMAKILNEVDFAIVSPSVIVHELLFMKTKFITIQTALNQKYMHEYLLKKNYLAINSFNEKILKTYVEILIKDSCE